MGLTSRDRNKCGICAKKEAIRLLSIFFAVILFLTLSSTLTTATFLYDGLKVYYNFDSPRDLVKGAYNLSANEGTMTFNSTDCLIGKCGQTWQDNNFKIPSNPITTYTGDYSMNFWVRGIDTGPTINPYFLGTTHLSTYQFGWDNWLGGNPTTFIYRQDGWTGEWGNLPGGMVGYKNWFMMTITRNSSTEEVKIYRDGVLRHSGTRGTTPPGEDILLGNVGNNIFDWHGQFDEFGYWNRTLNSSEIEKLYNNGNGTSFGFATHANITLAFTAYPCYQETANQPTMSDGNCSLRFNGSYSYGPSGSNTFYVNYTPPSFISPGSEWIVKTSNFTTNSNITGFNILKLGIPDNCIFNSTTSFRVIGPDWYNPQIWTYSCFNFTSRLWKTLFIDANGPAIYRGSSTSERYSDWFDGNWSTGGIYGHDGAWYDQETNSTVFYEEAVNWNATARLPKLVKPCNGSDC